MLRLRLHSRFVLLFVFAASIASASEGVILLHGLMRTERSMSNAAAVFAKKGYIVLNVDYPSNTASIEDLAKTTLSRALADPKLANVSKVHFVTHSMGGILVRQYLSHTRIERLGRVVMLGPPNQGSEVVDRLVDNIIFKMNGPAGGQLGTGADSLPNRLGAVDFEVGIIAGDRSVNWINSMMIDGPDDGKVSVEKTKVTGMTDHIVIHATHPFLMSNAQAIELALRFLRTGKFRTNSASSR